MNIRNLFGRKRDAEQQEAATYCPVQVPAPSVLPEPPQQMTVPPTESALQNRVAPSVSPWIVRDRATFEQEKSAMNHFWPQFSLEVIDDVESPYHGATCWSGKLVPALMEDMEWEILLIYQSMGGSGDWNGAIITYFLSPTDSQIVETLGYEPACFLHDEDGTLVLSNLRPILNENCSAAEAARQVFRFCQTVERMCIGELPENTLRCNTFLKNKRTETSPTTPDDNDNTDISDQASSDTIYTVSPGVI